MVLRNLPLIKASGPKTCASMRLKASRIAFSIKSLRRLSRCFRTALATRTANDGAPRLHPSIDRSNGSGRR